MKYAIRVAELISQDPQWLERLRYEYELFQNNTEKYNTDMLAELGEILVGIKVTKC